MIISIKNRNEEKMGNIDLNNIPYSTQPGLSDNLKLILGTIEAQGVSLKLEEYDAAKSRFTIFEKVIDSSDPLFPLAFRDQLMNMGYAIEEIDPTLDREILQIIAELPEQDEDRKGIESNLDSLTYLQKTFLLEQLKSDLR